MEVWDLTLDELFVPTTNENADGRPSAHHNTAYQGFKCHNNLQTVDVNGNRLASCPDVKVRFRCLPGVTDLLGRVYTDVRARSDHPDFHVNRLHETPKVVNDHDGFKSVLNVDLNDGQNCGNHKNCGRTSRLMMKVIEGNDGIWQMLPKAGIPGAYNFTFQTHQQGNSVVGSQFFNYLGNQDQYPTTFEVFPQIRSVSPQIGSLTGGTLITIKGTGFITDGLGGEVIVEVGTRKCQIESLTETEIKCRTLAGTEEPQTFAESRIFTEINDMSSGSHHRQG